MRRFPLCGIVIVIVEMKLVRKGGWKEVKEFGKMIFHLYPKGTGPAHRN